MKNMNTMRLSSTMQANLKEVMEKHRQAYSTLDKATSHRIFVKDKALCVEYEWASGRKEWYHYDLSKKAWY